MLQSLYYWVQSTIGVYMPISDQTGIAALDPVYITACVILCIIVWGLVRGILNIFTGRKK